MNLLSLGLPFATQQRSPLQLPHAIGGHEIRSLKEQSAPGEADFAFSAEETATDVLDRIAKDWRPDALICWQPELFPPPRAIESSPVTTVAVISDWNLYYPQLQDNMARYDHVLCDKLGEKKLRLYGAKAQHLFPVYSQNPSVHTKMDLEKDIDVVFVGNLNHAIHVERGRFLEKIAALSGKYRVQICAGHFGEEYATLINRAKIVFNYSVRRELNLRCFEAMACDSLLFLERDNLEVSQVFQDRQDLVLYGEDDLVELVEYYLEHDGEREAIAASGYAKADALSGEKRIVEIIDWLEKAETTRERAFSGFDQNVKELADILQYVCVVPGQCSAANDMALHATVNNPESSEFLAAACMAGLSAMSHKSSDDAEGSRLILQLAKRACMTSPKDAVCWSNLAFVLKFGGVRDAEAQALELALRADEMKNGALLLGAYNEPYFVAWRRKLATDSHGIELLWAAAAARLATIKLEAGQFDDARALAMRSIEWEPDFALPYRVHAIAESRLGKPQVAVDILKSALHLAPFDGEFRTDLINALMATGDALAAKLIAHKSAVIFRACPGAADTVERFEKLSDD